MVPRRLIWPILLGVMALTACGASSQASPVQGEMRTADVIAAALKYQYSNPILRDVLIAYGGPPLSAEARARIEETIAPVTVVWSNEPRTNEPLTIFEPVFTSPGEAHIATRSWKTSNGCTQTSPLELDLRWQSNRWVVQGEPFSAVGCS